MAEDIKHDAAEESAETSKPEDAAEAVANAEQAGTSSDAEQVSTDAPAEAPAEAAPSLAEHAAPGDLVHVVAPALGVVGLFKVVEAEAEHLKVCALDREHEIARVLKADVKDLFVHVEAVANLSF